MVTIGIGNETRSLSEARPSWITDQITGRRRDGQDVCVEVLVNTGALHVRLMTPGCGASAAGGRPPSEREQDVFDLWNRHRLSGVNFTGGDLVAFLAQIERWVS